MPSNPTSVETHKCRYTGKPYRSHVTTLGRIHSACVGCKRGTRNVPSRHAIGICPLGRVYSRNEKRGACCLCRLLLTQRFQRSLFSLKKNTKGVVYALESIVVSMKALNYDEKYPSVLQFVLSYSENMYQVLRFHELRCPGPSSRL